MTEAAAPLTDEALIAAACSKAGLVWMVTPQGRRSPLWHIWQDGAVVVVVGGQEQPDPVPDGATTVEVHVPSKDHRGRLVTFLADVEEIRPDEERWERATFALKGGRLNATDTEHLLDRWASGSRVLRLVPGEVLERPGSYDDASGAAVPVPTPATTDTWKPFHAGGRKRPRRRPR